MNTGWKSTRGKRVIYEQQTDYTLLKVINHGRWRYLMFDDHSGDPRLDSVEGVYQTKIWTAQPGAVVDSYGAAFHIPLLYTDVRNCLFIGLGGGAIISQYLYWYPDMRITAIEIDPAVVKVAREYFFLQPGPRLQIKIGDGRTFLTETSMRYDLICVDAFGARTIPKRLATREFAALCLRRLLPSGLIAMNINCTLTGHGSTLLHRISAGFAEQFPQVALFPTISRFPERYQAVILAAGRTPAVLAAQPRPKVRQLEQQGFTPRLGELLRGRLDVQEVMELPLSDDGEEPDDLLIYQD